MLGSKRRANGCRKLYAQTSILPLNEIFARIKRVGMFGTSPFHQHNLVATGSPKKATVSPSVSCPCGGFRRSKWIIRPEPYKNAAQACQESVESAAFMLAFRFQHCSLSKSPWA